MKIPTFENFDVLLKVTVRQKFDTLFIHCLPIHVEKQEQEQEAQSKI